MESKDHINTRCRRLLGHRSTRRKCASNCRARKNRRRIGEFRRNNTEQSRHEGLYKKVEKATSLITPTMDESLVMSLDVLERDPCLMWEKLAADFNKVTSAQKSSARMAFLTFKIPPLESYLETKHRFDELLRLVAV